MKKRFIMPVTAIMILLIAAVFIARTFRHVTMPKPSGSLQVAASIGPLADMVRQVGGSDVNVQTILPPGASPHTFEPTPEDIRTSQTSKLIFVIGHGLDAWAKPIADNAPNARIVTVDRDIALRNLPADQIDQDTPNETVDPHYWLTVANAKIISRNIADALSQADPNHKDAYLMNLASYFSKLDRLDQEIRSKLTNLSHKELITHHNAWGYFADAYGLKVVGTFEVSPGKDPTPQQIADLQDKVKRYGIKTIFSEPQLSDQSLRPFVQDMDIKIAVLDPEGGLNGMGYVDMMRYNADTIANALK